MSGRRWLDILRFFHTFNLQAVPRNNQDRLIRVRPVMEYISQRSRQVYTPLEHLSLDEGGMPWRGRLNFRVYNPQKPEKYCIKMYMLAESGTGYMYSFEVYSGVYKTTRDTVFNLTESLHGKGYKLYMDNYYNSVGLCSELFDQKVYVCGTMRLVRGAPTELQQIAKGHLEDDALVARHKDNVMVLLWKDKRIVNMITTFHNTDTVDKQRRKRVKRRDGTWEYPLQTYKKPVVVEDYNKYMSGVDHFDQMIQYYSFTRKTHKWTKKIVFYFLEMALYNSFVMYRKYCSLQRPKTLLEYLEFIIRKLIHFKSDEWPLSGNNIDHAPDLPAALVAPIQYPVRRGRGRTPARARGIGHGRGRPRGRGPACGMGRAVPRVHDSPSDPDSPMAVATEEDVPSPAVPTTPATIDAPATPPPGPSADQAPATPPLGPSATPAAPPAAAPGLSATPAAPPAAATRTPAPRAARLAAADARQARAAAAAAQEQARGTRGVKRTRIVDSDTRLDTSRLHSVVKIKDRKRLRCRVCYVKRGVRKDTYYECSTCDIPLCLGECVRIYHTDPNLS